VPSESVLHVEEAYTVSFYAYTVRRLRGGHEQIAVHRSLASIRGPLVLGILCVIPVLLWARSAPFSTRFESQSQALTSLAVVLALAGTSAFALNLVLGARLRIVEALFGGLDRMYSIHRANGQIVFLLLLGHVILILAGRATVSARTALDLLLPGAGWTVFAGVLAFAGMTVSILLTLFARLGHEVFVYVQRSFGFVFLAATYHVFTTDGAKAGSPALKWYLAALSTLGIAAFAYRSLFGNVLVRRRPYRVQAVNRLDESVTEIVMEPLGRPLAHAAGQFVFVNFRPPALGEEMHPLEFSLRRQVFAVRPGEIANQFHPFSITSAPGEEALRITVKAVGDYTRALRRLEPGAEAVVEGAYGSFSHESAGGARQIWLAGGIGVTPFLSMARSLGTKDGPVIDFYYCVEHEAEAHFLDELEAIADRRADFRVVVVPRDRSGFFTARRLEEELGDLSSAHTFICGPPAMIESLRSQLVELGVPATHIHAEEFGFAKVDSDELGRERWYDRPALTLIPAVACAGLLVVTGLSFAGWMAGRGENGATSPQPAGPAAGKRIFVTAGCADCHTLEAAGAHGDGGPDLDEMKPDAASVREAVTNGKGAMPAFDDELTSGQIETLADFVSTASR
jgi:predicted ferric reductase/mono/diheme cytochrome c family protein